MKSVSDRVLSRLEIFTQIIEKERENMNISSLNDILNVIIDPDSFSHSEIIDGLTKFSDDLKNKNMSNYKITTISKIDGVFRVEEKMVDVDDEDIEDEEYDDDFDDYEDDFDDDDELPEDD